MVNINPKTLVKGESLTLEKAVFDILENLWLNAEGFTKEDIKKIHLKKIFSFFLPVLDLEDINFLKDLIEELPKLYDGCYKPEAEELENILFRLTGE